MKTHIYWLPLVLSVFIACQDVNDRDETAHSHDNAVKEQGQQTVTLQLNDGERWYADDPTNRNMKRMGTRLDEFQKIQSPTAEDYNTLGGELHLIFQDIFRQCTMKGEAHDELHKVLYQMKGPIATLKGDSLQDAERAVEKLQGSVMLYEEYFE